VLRKGDRGEDVANWQRTLGIPADGIFGPQTEEATKQFQRDKGLVADGIVGPKTRQAAQAAPAPAPAPAPPLSSFRVIPKAEWGAALTRGSLAPLALPVSEFWVHHTAGSVTDDAFADARQVQEIAFSRGFDDTSYCYLIHPNGMVLEGRGLVVGAHTKGRNSISIGVSFIGNLSEVEPTPAAMESCRQLQGHLVAIGAISSGYGIRGHRDNPESPSQCPGNRLYPRLSELGKDPNTDLPSAPLAPPNNEEIIMALPLVRQGDKNQHVRNVQGLLNANGESVAIDGDFGPGTHRGLTAWQGRAGLIADGIVGPKTWRALLSV
jgi:peptidoglycan hydrolase-like protein with peptidoglycan-binding domain